MSLVFSTSSLAGEQTIKLGFGYKEYKAGGHALTYHSGRYFHAGYGYSFGKNLSHKFQFQVSNSNREVQYELPYVTASTNLDVQQEFNFPILSIGKYSMQAGGFIGNSFSLNFFPLIDNNNFIWENLMLTGISSRNSFITSTKGSLELNFQIPLFSYFLSHRFDRFTGEAPKTSLSTWEIMDKQIGSINKLFKPTLELGYEHKIKVAKLGFYYQAEPNRYVRKNGSQTRTNTHSLSLRITY